MKILQKLLVCCLYSTLFLNINSNPLSQPQFDANSLIDTLGNDLLNISNSLNNTINKEPFNSIVGTLENVLFNVSNVGQLLQMINIVTEPEREQKEDKKHKSKSPKKYVILIHVVFYVHHNNKKCRNLKKWSKKLL